MREFLHYPSASTYEATGDGDPFTRLGQKAVDMNQGDEAQDPVVAVFEITMLVPGDDPEIFVVPVDVESVPAASNPICIDFHVDDSLEGEDDLTDEEADVFFRDLADRIITWCSENEVVPLEDVFDAVLFAALATDVEERATDVQLRKYEQFCAMDQSEAVVDVLRDVVAEVDLSLDEVGQRWGVTVAVAKDSLLRLNVGNRVLMDVRPRRDASAAIELMIVGEVEIPEELKRGVVLREGFEAVEGSAMIAFPIENAPEVLELVGLFDAVRAHADASGRNLPQENWHNPMSELLLFD